MKNRVFALMGEMQKKKNRPVTQSEVAAAVGLTRQGFNKLVRNELKSYSVDVLDGLCRFFDCEVGDILYRVEGEPSEQVESQPG